jgi:hypothetical protein
MLIIPMLSQKSNSSLSVIWIWTRHVQVIYEIDQFL